MENCYSGQRGGNSKGGPGRENALHQAFRTPTETPPSEIVARASQFLEDNNLHTKITRVHMFNRRGIEAERFIPQRALYDIWQDRLRDFLQILEYTADDQALGYIRDNLLKILSILVAIEWGEWNKFPNIFLAQMNDPNSRRLDKSIPFPLDALEHESFLGSRVGERFYTAQYAFIPIIIEEKEYKEYPSWKRLPFIRSARKHLGEGSYGSVTKEIIAVNQFKWKDSQNLNDIVKPVARKRFKAYGDFRKETRNLVDLNSSVARHDHIVGYIAIIVIGDDPAPKDFNILLPLASMDLKQFLYSQDSDLPEFRIVDLIQQASMVAHAIQWLHEGIRIRDQQLICCHLDLKLDNILVYLDEDAPIGKWKISDFGISALQEPEEVPAVRKHKSGGLSVPGQVETLSSPAESLARLTKTARVPADRPPAIYQAPEAFKGNMVGRPSDVWSFGCILFQILARGVGPGVETLEELDELRRLERNRVTSHPTDYFFREHQGGSGCYLNPHIDDWLKCGTSGRSFKDQEVVRDCKRVILEILQIVPSQRLSAKVVSNKLLAITNSPMSDSMSENQSQSPTSPRISSADSVPVISVSAVPGTPRLSEGIEITQGVPSSSSGATFTPPVSRSYQFETWRSMPVRSVTPPEDFHGPPQMPHTDGLHSAPDLSHISEASHANIEQGSSHSSKKKHLSQTVRESRESPPARKIMQAHSSPDNRPLENFDQTTGTNTTPTSRGSASYSSNRKHSYASSAESRVSFETVPCETTEFHRVKDVVQAYISPTTANIAFITDKSILVRTAYAPYSYLTITTEGVQWESGSMAGDYLTAVGKYKASKQRTFRLYKVSTDGVLLIGPQSLRVVDPPLNLSQVVVSQHGRLLFQCSNCAWLYGYCNDTKKQALIITALETYQSQSDTLQAICFGIDGLWAFSETPLPGNLTRVRVWFVDDINTSNYYDYQHERRDSTEYIKHVIPFPKSPFCIIWDENNKLYILNKTGAQGPRQPFQVDNLHALVITPDEKAVIFITERRSKISFSRIQNENGNYSFVKQENRGALEKPLRNPKRCAVAIVETNAAEDTVKLLVAYCDGTYANKQVSFK